MCPLSVYLLFVVLKYLGSQVPDISFTYVMKLAY